MTTRSDGRETRDKLIRSACKVFSKQGLRDATVAEICKHAGANCAAVNYHFGSKRALYVEVWQYAMDLADRMYPFDGGVAADAPAEERLRGHIGSLIRRITDEGDLGALDRLIMRETVRPTGVVDEQLQQYRNPQREQLRQAIGELLGPGADPLQISLGEMSVIGQCRALKHVRGRWQEVTGQPAFTSETRELAIEHIACFTIGGLSQLRAEHAQTNPPGDAAADAGDKAGLHLTGEAS